MSSPCALFIDLRRAPVETWPEGWFSMAYIVTGQPEPTEAFFKTHYKSLAAIPHITCEITDADTFHLVIRQRSVTRLSLPHALVTDGLSTYFALDAIIQCDHRRSLSFYRTLINRLLEQGVGHLSLYGLSEFAVWQHVQTDLNAQKLFFYDRFHAARPGLESPYQNHLAAFGDVLALEGWSRVTDGQTTQVKPPRQKNFNTLDPATRNEEKLLLGMGNRRGVPCDLLTPPQIERACQSGLAIVQGKRLRPTDEGLWQTERLVAELL